MMNTRLAANRNIALAADTPAGTPVAVQPAGMSAGFAGNHPALHLAGAFSSLNPATIHQPEKAAPGFAESVSAETQPARRRNLNTSENCRNSENRTVDRTSVLLTLCACLCNVNYALSSPDEVMHSDKNASLLHEWADPHIIPNVPSLV